MPLKPRKSDSSTPPVPSKLLRDSLPAQMFAENDPKRVRLSHAPAKKAEKGHVAGTESNITDVVENAVRHNFPEAASFFHVQAGKSRLLERFDGIRVVGETADRQSVFDITEGVSIVPIDNTLAAVPDSSFDVLVLVMDPERNFPLPKELARVARMGFVVAYPYLWGKQDGAKPHLIGADVDWLAHHFGRPPSQHSQFHETIHKSWKGEWGLAIYHLEKPTPSVSRKFFAGAETDLTTLVRQAMPWLLVRSVVPRRVLVADPQLQLAELLTPLLRVGTCVDLLMGRNRDNLANFHEYEPPTGSAKILPVLAGANELNQVIPPLPVYDAIFWANGINDLVEAQPEDEMPGDFLTALKKRASRVVLLTGTWEETGQPQEQALVERKLNYCGATKIRTWLAWTLTA